MKDCYLSLFVKKNYKLNNVLCMEHIPNVSNGLNISNISNISNIMNVSNISNIYNNI